MLSALIKLRELGRCARQGRYEQVLSIARDPLIREHRRAVEASEKARKVLLDEAETHEFKSEFDAAARLFRLILQDREHLEARQGLDRVLENLEQAAQVERQAARGVSRVTELLHEGRAVEALEALEGGLRDHPQARPLISKAQAQLSAADRVAGRATDALKVAGVTGAIDALCSGPREGIDGTASRGAWIAVMKAASKERGSGAATRVLAGRPRGVFTEDGEWTKEVARLEEQARQDLEELIKKGDRPALEATLAHFPLGLKLDDRGSQTAEALRSCDKAAEAWGRGDARIAEEAAQQVERVFGRSPLAKSLRKQGQELESDLESLAAVDREVRAGQINAARARLMDLAERWPRHREVQGRLADLEQREADDLRALVRAREAIAAGDHASLEEAGQLLIGLKARRADLDTVALLQRELDLARERMPAEAASRAPHPARESRRGLRFRRVAPEVPRPTALPVDESGPTVEAAMPWVLRVEEAGDWLVHPGSSLLIGSVGGGVADLPVMAAISSRHARIERQGTRYRLVAEPDAPVTRNYRRVDGAVDLEHGDRIKLGRVLELRFRQPVEDNATAVLHLEGDFQVHGCRRVLLAAEPGREGSIVIGPGPRAHVELGHGADRVELHRRESGGDLFARSPHGVASGEGEPRPQVRVAPRSTVRAMRIAFFVEPLR